MMKAERMIEILNEVMSMCDGNKTNENNIWHKCNELKKEITAMQRAVEEETTTLRAELERLKQCEAIVRELAEYDPDFATQHTPQLRQARQWVKDNTIK